MHREGAEMLVDGRRTVADLKLNPAFDRAFLELVTGKELERIDSIDARATVARAGIGSLELHAWVAATAANAAAGGATPVVDIYAEALEYGIAFGMMHAYGS
jgi:2,3-dihydroxyphenylpropionate 1,2-dioxygenase